MHKNFHLIYIPGVTFSLAPNTMYHHNPYNQQQRTKIEMKIASFLSISFFPTCKQQSRTKIDANIVFFSIDILFSSTKFSLLLNFLLQTIPQTNPQTKFFSLSTYLKLTPRNVFSYSQTLLTSYISVPNNQQRFHPTF